MLVALCAFPGTHDPTRPMTPADLDLYPASLRCEVGVAPPPTVAQTPLTPYNTSRGMAACAPGSCPMPNLAERYLGVCV